MGDDPPNDPPPNAETIEDDLEVSDFAAAVEEKIPTSPPKLNSRVLVLAVLNEKPAVEDCVDGTVTFKNENPEAEDFVTSSLLVLVSVPAAIPDTDLSTDCSVVDVSLLLDSNPNSDLFDAPELPPNVNVCALVWKRELELGVSPPPNRFLLTAGMLETSSDGFRDTWTLESADDRKQNININLYYCWATD